MYMSEKETKTPRGYSTVNVHTIELANLSVISLVTGKDKSTILNEFIARLYESVFPHVAKAIAEKRQVIFDYDIMATIKEPMVFGSRQVPMNEPDAKTKKDTLREVKRKFAELEKKKVQK